MRLFDLYETLSPDFERFEQKWGDYIYELSGEFEITPEQYIQMYTRISESSPIVAWRTIKVPTNWVKQLNPRKTHLGIFWTKDKSFLFSHALGDSPYDERFPTVQEPKVEVWMEGLVDPSGVDIDASIASELATHEDELRLFEGATVKLRKIWVNREEMDHPMEGEEFSA